MLAVISSDLCVCDVSIESMNVPLYRGHLVSKLKNWGPQTSVCHHSASIFSVQSLAFTHRESQWASQAGRSAPLPHRWCWGPPERALSSRKPASSLSYGWRIAAVALSCCNWSPPYRSLCWSVQNLRRRRRKRGRRGYKGDIRVYISDLTDLYLQFSFLYLYNDDDSVEFKTRLCSWSLFVLCVSSLCLSYLLHLQCCPLLPQGSAALSCCFWFWWLAYASNLEREKWIVSSSVCLSDVTLSPFPQNLSLAAVPR